MVKSYVLLTLFQIVRYGIAQEDIKVEDFTGDANLTYLANLSIFKRQLQELLVIYSLQIPLKDFIRVFQQRYGRGLDLPSFGVDSLEALSTVLATEYCSRHAPKPRSAHCLPGYRETR